MRVLGIETSCDETGLAIYDTARGLVAHALHSQVAMHEAYGGVVPELASRDHVRRVVPLAQRVVSEAGLTFADLDGIAYTQGPGLAGALLVGASVAHALGFALVEFVLAVCVMWRFTSGSAAMQHAERVRWIPSLGISYHLAVDGISVLFVGLTALLTVLIIVYSWDTIRHQVKLYMMCLLALETTTMGVFVSLDLILFFVFWELMLIPSYFLIKLSSTVESYLQYREAFVKFLKGFRALTPGR